ncbi:WD40 repeat-like protein [Gyrodon lividus]|nr:WD40 repeat-like protein [Gyrodon lividus]
MSDLVRLDAADAFTASSHLPRVPEGHPGIPHTTADNFENAFNAGWPDVPIAYSIRSVAFLPDGKQVISGSNDESVRGWRVQDGREVGGVMKERGRVFAVAASSNGQWIATGGEARRVTLWNTTTPHKKVELEGHSHWVRSLAFSPESTRVVSGSSDGTVIIWSTTKRRRLAGPLKGHTDWVESVSFSPNGDEIASCDGRDIRVWNCDSGELVIPPIKVNARSLAWSPDGQQLIAGCEDGFIRCFHSSTGSLLVEWNGHTNGIYSIAISPSGKFIASGSWDSTIRLWDTTTQQPIGSALQHGSYVLSVAISPYDSHLASGGNDGKVRIWDLESVMSPPLFENTPTPSNDALADVREANVDLQQISSDKDRTRRRRKTQREWTPQGRGIPAARHRDASSSMQPVQQEDVSSAKGHSSEVAVKAIRTYAADDGDDTQKKKRLRREIRVWLNLEHSNVLPLFGTTMNFGRFPAMVCPWLEDGPLSSYLERRDNYLTMVERFVLLHDVAVGLQYLHSRSVVHGDLSGSNVLIHGNGRACIADFGLSTLLTELGGSTFSTSLQGRGTLRWAAPELLNLNVQVSGEEENIPRVPPTPRSDTYSFGGIMLQVLTGRIPYYYYPRDERVLLAVSQGETPKRPSPHLTVNPVNPVITDHQWVFIQQCWSTVNEGQLRPSDGDMSERDMSRGHPTPRLRDPHAGTPEPLVVISGSEDSSVRTWRIKDGREVGTLLKDGGAVLAVAASNDGRWIATGGEKAITIWDATSHRKVVELEGHSGSAWSLAFSPDSARVVSGSPDRTVTVWSTTTAERLTGPLKGHTSSVWSVSFSPNGDQLASCDMGEIRLCNSHTGELVIPPIKVKARSLRWSPNGQQLIAGCWHGSIKSFHSSTGLLLAEWKAHSNLVRSIAVSPNGKFIASASSDKIVRLWDTRTSAQVVTTLQHDGEVNSVAISPDGRHLVSGGNDRKIRIWSLKGVLPPSLLDDKLTTPKGAPQDVGFHVSSRPSLMQVHEINVNQVSNPPAPPKITENDQGIDPGPSVSISFVPPLRIVTPNCFDLLISQVIIVGDSNVNSRSSLTTTSITIEQSTQDTAWDLDDIRSSFPNDLTDHVMREGEYPIASGSYGDIYRGTFRLNGRSVDVAVKAIRTYSVDSSDYAHKKKRLRREITVWLNLKHVNVLPLFGTTTGFGLFPAMVCPWLEGGTLTSYLERRDDSLTVGERFVLLHDVAVGLQYLHSRSVVHGDLSGSNVLIHDNGRACIADFGLSTLLTELGGSTFSTSLQGRGTLRWAAPELLNLNVQVSGEEENIPRVPPTPGSDIYSFGGIMLQVLTGRIPFYYFPRDERVLLALSQGEIPKRPGSALITDHRRRDTPVTSSVFRYTGMSRPDDSGKGAYRPVERLPVPFVPLGHTGRIWLVAFLPGGKRVLSGSDDRSVRISRARDGHEVGTVMKEADWVFAVAASSDGHWIATGGLAKSITIWDATTHKQVVELEGHSSSVWSIAFSPDSMRVASSSDDQTVIIWSAVTGERLAGPLKGHTNPVSSVGFSPDGETVASCDTRDIRVWNSHSGELVIPPVKVDAWSLAWSPDGQRLFAGCEHSQIKCIDFSTGSVLMEWRAHKSIVHSIAVSSNGKFLASGSWDSTARLWDTTTCTQIGHDLRHSQGVNSVAISPGGNHLVSGGDDRKVRIWSLQGILSQSLRLGNTPTTSNDVPTDVRFQVLIRVSHIQESTQVHEASVDGQQESNHLAQKVKDSQSPKNYKGKNLVNAEVVMTLRRRPNRLLWRSDFLDLVQEEALSSTEGHSSKPPVAAPKIIKTGKKGKGKGPGSSPSTSFVLVAGASNLSSGNRVTETSTAFKQLDTAWNLGDIRSSFANDLTGFVTRKDEDPIASGSYGDIYRSTFRASGRSIDVAVKAIRTYSADDCDGARKTKTGQRLRREIRVWLNLEHNNVVPLFGTTMGFGRFPAMAKGTLRWAAPELLDLEVFENGEDSPQAVPTLRSDVYSFGAIMLQVLTGQVPYHYYSRDAQVLHAISKGETPKRPSQAWVTDRRWTFIQRCWTPVGAGEPRPSDDEIVEYDNINGGDYAEEHVCPTRMRALAVLTVQGTSFSPPDAVHEQMLDIRVNMADILTFERLVQVHTGGHFYHEARLVDATMTLSPTLNYSWRFIIDKLGSRRGKGTNSKIIEIASPSQVFSVAFTRDRKHVIAGGSPGDIHRWGLEDGRQQLHGPTMKGDSTVMALTVSMDGRWIVAGSDRGKKVIVWDASTHDKVLEITKHTNLVRAIDVSNDSTRIATGSHDHTVQIFSITSGKRLLVPLQHSNIVMGVKFSPDDSRLATATHCHDSVRVYDSHSGEIIFDIPVKISPYHRCTPFVWSSDSRCLFTVVPGKITSFDLSISSRTEWSIHNTDADASIVSNGKFIACSAGSTVSIWDPISRTQIGPVLEHNSTIWDIALSSDGRYLACVHDTKITLHRLNDLLSHSYFSNPSLMEVSEEVLKSWSETDLNKTETTLSDEIQHASKPSHHAFANRSLVRVRSKQSLALLAIDDAKESLQIQPSPIGHIAMAIALLAQGDRDGSFCAFDLAFYECEPHETWLLLLFKAVLVFEGGRQDDAMKRVDYLAKRRNNDATYLCHQARAVLGGMYMHKREYGRAISHFESAKKAAPINGDCPPLVTISLIFGWAFDGLDIASQQHMYEVLFVEGRLREAAEILQNMVKESSEDAQKGKTIADWIVDFTQKYAATAREVTQEGSSDQTHQISTTDHEKHQDANPWSSGMLCLDHECNSNHEAE